MDIEDVKKSLDILYVGMPSKPDPAMSVVHFFNEDTYIRREVVRKERAVRMHVHTYDHFAIVCSGHGRLLTDDGYKEVKAGDVIEVKAGNRHAYYADSDTIWLCVHSANADEAKELYKVGAYATA
jgi:quercetin dioxygenase-like cupin family protein